MKRAAVLNVVGLTPSLLGPHTPRLAAFAQQGQVATVAPPFPAVTCTAQANYLTGSLPSRHGIVGNGWYERELAEVHFWKQSNHLVHGRKIWDELRARDPKFTCAQLFWWFNLYSGVDYSITPRPMYPADGRKVFDIHTWPYSIRTDIKRDLGEFPFPTFWGPAAGLDTRAGAADAASRWIAESAKWIERRYRPTLSLVYLPHLDYNLQRLGPCSRATSQPRPAEAETGEQLNPAVVPDLRRIDSVVGDLIDFFRERELQVVVLSEYGLTPVDTPVHLNRRFREQGWLTVKDELGLELLDCGASRVFAVADHQVAHAYLNDASLRSEVRAALEGMPGVAEVLDAEGKTALGIDHPRAGDLIAVAAANAWFTYYYWQDDRRAPDFARTVDIHRKPGYDPVELFLDPKIPAVKLRILWKLLRKRLGFRTLMDVVPLDATLVKGSHGRRPGDARDCPLLIVQQPGSLRRAQIASTDVYGVIRDLVA